MTQKRHQKQTQILKKVIFLDIPYLLELFESFQYIIIFKNKRFLRNKIKRFPTQFRMSGEIKIRSRQKKMMQGHALEQSVRPQKERTQTRFPKHEPGVTSPALLGAVGKDSCIERWLSTLFMVCAFCLARTISMESFSFLNWKLLGCWRYF